MSPVPHSHNYPTTQKPNRRERRARQAQHKKSSFGHVDGPSLDDLQDEILGGFFEKFAQAGQIGGKPEWQEMKTKGAAALGAHSDMLKALFEATGKGVTEAKGPEARMRELEPYHIHLQVFGDQIERLLSSLKDLGAMFESFKKR